MTEKRAHKPNVKNLCMAFDKVPTKTEGLSFAA